MYGGILLGDEQSETSAASLFSFLLCLLLIWMRGSHELSFSVLYDIVLMIHFGFSCNMQLSYGLPSLLLCFIFVLV